MLSGLNVDVPAPVNALSKTITYPIVLFFVSFSENSGKLPWMPEVFLAIVDRDGKDVLSPRWSEHPIPNHGLTTQLYISSKSF